MASATPLATNLFAEDRSIFDWDNYMRSRPDYTGSALYDRLFSYHASNAGSYDVAYDVGCGPGQVASALAARFRAVHGSDPNSHIISWARDALSATRNLDFEVGTAEDVVAVARARAGTADLVTAAECIPLMDTRAAMAAFAALLRPGGTLAIWFYGGPIFTSPGCAEAGAAVAGVQALFGDILNRSYDQFRPFGGGALERPCTMTYSWLDNVPFDPAWFKHVRRVKWNTDREFGFLKRGMMDFDIQHVSLIGDGEVVEDQGVDRSFLLTRDVDVGWAKGFIDSSIVREKDYVTEEVRDMYGMLEDKMKGRTWNVTWPAVLLLATKK